MLAEISGAENKLGVDAKRYKNDKRFRRFTRKRMYRIGDYPERARELRILIVAGKSKLDRLDVAGIAVARLFGTATRSRPEVRDLIALKVKRKR